MGYTHGTKWNEENIKEGIMRVVHGLELNRMPSRSEVDQFYGNYALTNAISKRVGWYKLAKELGLDIKDSETYFGKRYEKIVQEEIIAMGHEVRRMPQNFPYDLLVDDCVKIDVKASRLYTGKTGSFYSFNLEKPFCTCDIYILKIIEENGEIKDTLVIPSKDISLNTQVSVGANKSKYYRYRQKWKYIDEYVEFFESVN